jgi:protein-S-isoprenylcysteine O-methyltransferase Ste14
MNLKRISIGATSILVVAVVSLLLRRSLFGHGAVAIALQTVAVLLMLWARLTFGGRSFHAGADPTRGGLVTTGPYRFVRHPIYTAILFFMWTGVAGTGSIDQAWLTAIVATAAVVVRIVTEEDLVAAAYPEYLEYARHTKRLIPFVL